MPNKCPRNVFSLIRFSGPQSHYSLQIRKINFWGESGEKKPLGGGQNDLVFNHLRRQHVCMWTQTLPVFLEITIHGNIKRIQSLEESLSRTCYFCCQRQKSAPVLLPDQDNKLINRLRMIFFLLRIQKCEIKAVHSPPEANADGEVSDEGEVQRSAAWWGWGLCKEEQGRKYSIRTNYCWKVRANSAWVTDWRKQHRNFRNSTAGWECQDKLSRRY